MANLPPLRTVRDAAAAPRPATPGPFVARPSAPPIPGLPAAASQLLNELRTLDLLEPDAVRGFTARMADRLAQLNTRETAAAALVHCGILTGYQRDRVLSGHTHGLAFGPYRVLDRLGGGTVSVVFKAHHRVLGRDVAVKTLPLDGDTSGGMVDRFHAEMRLLARLEHPHVVRVYDAGTLPAAGDAPAAHYAVLELVPGGDLEHFIYEKGCQPVATAAEWGRQLADGLAAAHAHQLVHRDVKPSNVLLTADGRAKLSDFGLARHPASNRTPRPGMIGSIEFMAPEQLADPTTAGPPADVYGLAASLFWVLTGQLPYPQADSLAKAAAAITGGPPRRPRDVRPDLPPELDALLAKMMSRNPAARPTAAQAAAELGRFAHPLAAGGEAAVLREAAVSAAEAAAAQAAAARNAAAAVLTALAAAVRLRGERSGEQRRVQEYVRALAGKLAKAPGWVQFADPGFLDESLRCVAVRNIGLAAVPDAVLAKAAAGDPLTAAEREELERHADHGSRLLDAVARQHGESLGFVRQARAVVRSHHERWDGTGFPDRLAGDAIPPAARLVAVAEAYDALRKPVGGQPGLSHPEAVDGLVSEAKGMFDPQVLEAFVNANAQFEQIYATVPD